MFLKRLERHKSGKKHIYWALVQSVRTARGSRHRVVAYLGELKKSERSGWAQLGQRLNGRARSHLVRKAGSHGSIRRTSLTAPATEGYGLRLRGVAPDRLRV